MNDTTYVVTVLLAMGAVTLLLRALPFLAAQWLKRHPMVSRVGRVLPLSIMTLLTVHAAVGGAASHAAGPWPECVALGLVITLQVWRGQALLSMAAGTAVYVCLRTLPLASLIG